MEIGNIQRTPTDKEQKDFTQIGVKTPKDIFNKKLFAEKLKANKKGFPFCDAAARDDFNDSYKIQVTKLLRKYGSIGIEAKKEIKQPDMEWSQYSDLKNFELIKESERFDQHLSKRYNKQVYLKYNVYKYKEYGNLYTMMEPYPDAWKERKKMPEVQDDKQKKAKTK